MLANGDLGLSPPGADLDFTVSVLHMPATFFFFFFVHAVTFCLSVCLPALHPRQPVTPRPAGAEMRTSRGSKRRPSIRRWSAGCQRYHSMRG